MKQRICHSCCEIMRDPDDLIVRPDPMYPEMTLIGWNCLHCETYNAVKVAALFFNKPDMKPFKEQEILQQLHQIKLIPPGVGFLRRPKPLVFLSVGERLFMGDIERFFFWNKFLEQVVIEKPGVDTLDQAKDHCLRACIAGQSVDLREELEKVDFSVKWKCLPEWWDRAPVVEGDR